MNFFQKNIRNIFLKQVPIQSFQAHTAMKWRVEKSGGADEGRPARGPLAVALPKAFLSSPRREGPRPLPATTRSGQKLPRFTVFCALRIFSHFSDLVAQDGSTWANIGLKMGQHGPT